MRKTLRSRGKCYRTVHHRKTREHRAYIGHKRVKCTKVARKAHRKAPRRKTVRKARSECGCYKKAEMAEKRVLKKCLGRR